MNSLITWALSLDWISWNLDGSQHCLFVVSQNQLFSCGNIEMDSVPVLLQGGVGGKSKSMCLQLIGQWVPK
jgi:hypothetical protein